MLEGEDIREDLGRSEIDCFSMVSLHHWVGFPPVWQCTCEMFKANICGTSCLQSQRIHERKFSVSFINEQFPEAPMINWALLALGVFLALFDPHLVTILTLEGNGSQQAAELCDFYLRLPCYLHCFSRPDLTMYCYNLKTSFTYKLTVLFQVNAFLLLLKVAFLKEIMAISRFWAEKEARLETNDGIPTPFDKLFC